MAHELPSFTPALWREAISIHPEAERYPRLSHEELLVLSKDIEKHGLRQKIVLWTSANYEGSLESLLEQAQAKCLDLFLLDGRNRILAIEQISDEKLKEMLLADAFFNAKVFTGPPEAEPLFLIASLNLHRRHLRPTERQEILKYLIKARPDSSDRLLAATLHVSPTTVGAARAELEQTGEVSKLDRRTDIKGRQRPAKVAPRAVTRASTKSKSREQRRAEGISQFSETLKSSPARTLEDLIKLLGDQPKIAGLPLEKRTSLARGLLDALGLECEVLRARVTSASAIAP
jgi:hypothetical protein